MPLREYIASTEHNCPLCEKMFEHVSVGSSDLEQCPRCGAPVLLCQSSTFNAPEITQAVSVTDAKKAGFTVLKKISEGEYERQ